MNVIEIKSSDQTKTPWGIKNLRQILKLLRSYFIKQSKRFPKSTERNRHSITMVLKTEHSH